MNASWALRLGLILVGLLGLSVGGPNTQTPLKFLIAPSSILYKWKQAIIQKVRSTFKFEYKLHSLLPIPTALLIYIFLFAPKTSKKHKRIQSLFFLGVMKRYQFPYSSYTLRPPTEELNLFFKLPATHEEDDRNQVPTEPTVSWNWGRQNQVSTELTLYCGSGILQSGPKKRKASESSHSSVVALAADKFSTENPRKEGEVSTSLKLYDESWLEPKRRKP